MQDIKPQNEYTLRKQISLNEKKVKLKNNRVKLHKAKD